MTDNTELKSYYEYYDGQKDRHLMLEGNGDWANYEEAQRLLADKDKEIARINDLFKTREKAHAEYVDRIKKVAANDSKVLEDFSAKCLEKIDELRVRNEKLTLIGMKVLEDWWPLVHAHSSRETAKAHFKELLNAIDPSDES